MRENENSLRNLDTRVDRINSGIVDLNEKVKLSPPIFSSTFRPLETKQSIVFEQMVKMVVKNHWRIWSIPFRDQISISWVFQKNPDQNVPMANSASQIEIEIFVYNLIFSKVCDGRGDPCDSRCGGGGCGKCGGVSCDQGAATKSENSIDLAERADALLMEKQQIVSQMLRSVSFIDFIKPLKASKHECSQTIGGSKERAPWKNLAN